MRRKPLAALLLALPIVCPARAQAPAPREAYVPVFVDGRLSGQALVREGTAYLSLRSVAKALRLDVRYNPDTQLIFIKTPASAALKSGGKPVQ